MVRSKDTRHAFAVGVGAVCLSTLVACTGMVTGSDGNPSGANPLPPDGQGQGAGSSSSGGGSGLPGAGNGSGGLAAQQPIDPGAKLIHRLNTAEYNNTVADVLGTTVVPGDNNWAAEETAGFDNIAAVQLVDAKQYKKYYDAAGAVATDVFANASAKAKIVTCAATDDAACVDGIIKATGLRLFRRPLTAEEVTTYHQVYTDARGLSLTHEPALQQVVTALLASAEFLFRMEFDADPASTTVHELNGYELASRLSYFLWQSAPDDALLAAAAADLPKTETLTAQYDRAVADAKFERSTRGFVGQWLGIRKVATHAVKADAYPDWTPAVGSAMAEEAYRFWDEFAKGDRPWTEFVKADVNFVDTNLAKLYGMTPPAAGTERVENTGDQRFGFLGLGAFLALSSYEYRTAPTLRGRWILLNLLCTPPHEPPPGIPALDAMPNADASAQNVRKRLEEHRKNPACATCHATLDPYGLALENFDGIGKYRANYGNNTPIDASTITEDGVAFTGLSGLADEVLKKPTLYSCVEQKLFTYALGREITATDNPYIAQIDKAWTADKPTLPRLMKSLVLADTFRKRHGGI